MPEQRNVKMKALRTFENKEHEGQIQRGSTFFTTEKRARALANGQIQLAQRFPAVELGDGMPATNEGEKIDTVSEGAGGPLDPDQGRSELTADPTGETQPSPSSSPEGQAPPHVTVSDRGNPRFPKAKGKRRG